MPPISKINLSPTRTTTVVSTTARTGTTAPSSGVNEGINEIPLPVDIRNRIRDIKERGLRPSPQPIPDPNPVPPPEEIPGDPKLIPGEKGLDQNEERYSDRGVYWQIQSEPQITPLELVKGMRPELKPVLMANGVVVKIGDEYICSKRTLADILNSNNPHYDVAENGRVLNRPMGRSIPIIQIDVSKLKELGDSRDRVNRYSGVKSVDYLDESDKVPGTNIPQGLLNQLNWTMVEGLGRWPDRFQVWDLLYAMQGNYSVERLVTTTMQEEDKLDKKKLESFLTGMDERLKRIRSDFNMIKRMFYNGEPPPNTTPTLKYYRIARTVDPDEENSKNSTVIKTTQTVGVQETLSTLATNRLDNAISEIKLGGMKTGVTDPITGAGIRVQQPGQSAALITKWQSYKWTEEESAYLKTISVKEVEDPPTKISVYQPRTSIANPKWIYYGVKDVTTDRITGINRVRWTPAMLSKAAIIDPLPTSWGSVSMNIFGKANPVINSTLETRLTGLYGTPPVGTSNSRIGVIGMTATADDKREYWWINENNKRQAEIVKLAYDIHKIELETGKTIPAIPPPSAPVAATSIHRAAG